MLPTATNLLLSCFLFATDQIFDGWIALQNLIFLV